MQFETYVSGIPNALTLAFGIHFFITRQQPLLVHHLFLYLLITSFYSYFSSWRDPFILAFVSLSGLFATDGDKGKDEGVSPGGEIAVKACDQKIEKRMVTDPLTVMKSECGGSQHH